MLAATRVIAALSRFAVAAASAALCSIAPASAATVSLRVDPMIVEFATPSEGDQKASISIANDGSAPERIVAQGVDWHTSVEGNVTLEQVGAERDRSLTPYLSLSPSSFILQPGETRDVALTYHVPGGRTSSVAARWGGFLIRATGVHDPESSMAPGATVFVYETVGTPRRHLALTSLSLRFDHARVPELSARFVNDGETYLRPLCRLVIVRGDTLVRDVALPANVIFPGDKRAMRESIEPLPAGDYRLHLTVDYGGSSILDGALNVRVP